MCSYITEQAAIVGSAKGPTGWMHVDTATVYFDHPYHSPLPDLDDIRAREDKLFVFPGEVTGVELEVRSQLELVDELSRFYDESAFVPHPTAGFRYYYENDWFNLGDAVMLHTILRAYRPARVVEIGSGYSSAVMLDTNERYMDRSIEFTFVDPEPSRLLDLLTEEDHKSVRLLSRRLQDVDVELFSEIAPGDVLFIDSSHVSKIGSDVNLILFEIVPRLAPGVLVHFHDVFYPFQYPREWIYEGRAWNETYLVRAFLAFNSDFRVRLFNSYLERFHADRVRSAMPLWARQQGSCSLWLERRKGSIA